MAHNKSPGPDGFTAEFQEHFQDFIKHDLKAMFDDFHKGKVRYKKIKLWDYHFIS